MMYSVIVSIAEQLQCFDAHVVCASKLRMKRSVCVCVCMHVYVCSHIPLCMCVCVCVCVLGLQGISIFSNIEVFFF